MTVRPLIAADALAFAASAHAPAAPPAAPRVRSAADWVAPLTSQEVNKRFRFAAAAALLEFGGEDAPAAPAMVREETRADGGRWRLVPLADEALPHLAEMKGRALEAAE